MIKKLPLILLIFAVISCNNSNEHIDKKIVKELARGDFETPSINGFFMLFVAGNKGDKGCTNVNVLHHVFLKRYSKVYPDFELFLSDALNQKLKFSDINFGGGIDFFKIDSTICKKYNESDLDDFINVHFDKSHKTNKLSIKQAYINEKQLFSILYYCFINNYQVTSDDYIGGYYIGKFINR